MVVEQMISAAGFFKRKLVRNDFLRIKLILFDLLVNLRHQMDDRSLPHFSVTFLEKNAPSGNIL